MTPSKSMHRSAPPRQTALAAAALWLCALPAVAEPADQSGTLGLRPSQSGAPATDDAGPSRENESIDWNALNWDVSKLNATSAWQTPAPSKPDLSWDRAEKRDGSSAVTVKKTLPSAWESKVGVESKSGEATGTVAPLDPDKLLPGAGANASDGAAWASVTAPSLNVPAGWDKATFDARFDPTHEERKLGTTVSKSVPLNERFSVTLQNGYSMTQTQASGQVSTATATAMPGTALGPAQQPLPYGQSHYFSSDNTAKLNVLPTGTSLSVGTAMSTTDDKWRRSLGAEQKLFGGISVKGSVSETPTGIPDKSISAGFTRTW
jgi:hypothetical protein